MSAAEARIAIAAATYNRPDGLAKLLDGLAVLVIPHGIEAWVVIVDNSAEGTAREQVEGRVAGFPFPLHYRHEPEPGITQARNAALADAVDRKADWIAFIDDDEWPEPDWLRVLASRRADGVSAIFGSVLPVFESTPPRWIERSPFYEVKRAEDGAELETGHCGNCLIRLADVTACGLEFDAGYALSGGEDTLFFRELRRCAGTLVSAPGAIVRESVPASRMSLRWLMRRWERTGNTDSRIALDESGGRARLKTLTSGLGRTAIGGAMAVATAPFALLGRAEVPAAKVRIMSRGIGFVRTALGTITQEYRR